ncbi:MAG: hypothetical protein WCJ41_22075 [Aestuariivirga sp.]|uniref:hypothetical protein n=1 Tax=Aestuariivirga sp. TaxID=2650926 RepID=UPI00301A3B89
MLKRRSESNREGEADIPPVPAPGCPPSVGSPEGFTVETDLSADRQVTDAELEAICRLLGDDLVRLLDQSQSH